MSNLLSIETAFLSQSEIKNALNLNDIKRIQRQITNAHKSKFGHTLTMAKLVVKAEEWFTSEDGKFKMFCKITSSASLSFKILANFTEFSIISPE